MAKGNRNPKETKPIDYREVHKARQEITEAARNLALKCREKSPYAVDKQSLFMERLEEYVKKQADEGKPLTISGFILASKIPQQVWNRMKNGEYDGMIYEYKMLHDIPEDAEYITTKDGEILPLLPWSEIVGRCYLLTQEQREEACVAGKAGNVIGNIFLLKSQHGLSDQPDQIQSQTNIQIVANSDTAMKALEMLK